MSRRLGRYARPRVGVVVGIAAGAVLLAHPAALAGSDVFSNVGPASQVPGGSLMDAYPLGHYGLDGHFKAVEAGVFSGVDVSGIAPTIAWFLAGVLWELTAFIATAAITLFTFAFSLDLLNGGGTGGSGALAPVSEAVRSIYRTMFGEPWLIAAIAATGLWAIWHALVRRRYTETAGALGLSVIFVVIALAFVSQPQATIGEASRWTNAMSGAFLSLSTSGDVTSQGRAKRAAADQLFALLVYEPWVVLNFGGREHCVVPDTGSDDENPDSVAVRPLARDPGRDAALSRRLARSQEIHADNKVCVNNRNKYAPRFLKYPVHSDDRDRHYDALNNGDTSKVPEQDRRGYRLSVVDKPAADAMEKDGQYQRLLLALVIFAGQLGAVALLGALSVAVILAQVVVLLLLAFAPIALVIGVFPGRGHDFFRSWLTKLAAFLVRKAVYSLILAVLLTVVAAVSDATASLGWLMAWGLQGAFFWSVLIWRRQLVGQITRAATGHQADDGGGGGRFASGYAVAHAAGRFWRRHRPDLGGAPAPAADARHGNRAPTIDTTKPTRTAPPPSDTAASARESSPPSRSPEEPSAVRPTGAAHRPTPPDHRPSSPGDQPATASARPGRSNASLRSTAPDETVSAAGDDGRESPLRRGLRGDRVRLHRDPHPETPPPPAPPPPERPGERPPNRETGEAQ